MPTYQYACTACQHQLEAVQSFTDEPLTECPECRGRLRKVFGSVGIVFKGSGFYRTDSRASNGKSGKESGGSGKKPDGASAKGGEQRSGGGDQSSSGTGEQKPSRAGDQATTATGSA